MKKFFLALLTLLALPAAVFSSPLSTETPIRSVGTGTTVVVSSTVWTLAPTAQTLPGQNGILVSFGLERSSATLAGTLGDCTGFTEATTIRPMHFIGGDFVPVPVADNVCLYLLSLESNNTISVHIKEFKQ